MRLSPKKGESMNENLRGYKILNEGQSGNGRR